MWEINKYLKEGEKVEYQDTPSWYLYFRFFLLALIIIFFTVIKWWMAIISLSLIVFIVYSKLSTKYIVTNKRIATRIGILSDNFKSLSFKYITSISLRQNLFGKMLNFGDIIIDTAGNGEEGRLRWQSVKNPIKVKSIMEKYIE